jgi:hypothetical protein
MYPSALFLRTGVAPNADRGEAMHQTSKSRNRCSSGRDLEQHYTKANTAGALCHAAEGGQWDAMLWDNEQRVHVRRSVRAGAGFLAVVAAARSKLLPQLPPSLDSKVQHSTYSGKRRTIKLVDSGATALSQPLLLAAYKRHYPETTATWHHLRDREVQAYTHFSALKGDTSGLGRFRGATTRTRAGNGPLKLPGDDVLVLLPLTPSSGSGSSRGRKQQAAAPCRLLYFFDHKPYTPVITSNSSTVNNSRGSSSSNSTSDTGVTKWAAVQMFVTVDSAGKHVCDHWSSHYVYAL